MEGLIASYQHRLRHLADELIAELDPSEQEQQRLLVIVELVDALVRTYDSLHFDSSQIVERRASVALAKSSDPRPILSVPLRRLVDYSTIGAWYARLLNSHLSLRRTVIIAGPANAGKSTLLNALLDLLPSDHRVVAIDDTEDRLPALRDRSFTVQLTAKQGTAARVATFRKASDMQPDWILVGDLARRDGPIFIQTLGDKIAGLATVDTADIKATLNDWISLNQDVLAHLDKVRPLIVQMERDQSARPRVAQVVEVSIKDAQLLLQPRRPA
jgi:type IV secretory pathway ATPase VirB11/archaellum biosynthesis ATPase